ncbi:hypothetical protein KSF_081710 [Reticulibacter mediterranei]|uniref:Uncharacterized protein n=2 Tax=Reticulibacter mediterranei TaxID=2778369 RepID=A0A8J3N708_9CHLR|nr:hypothetical protein KSF_081710 [Reticulibacter mediterranei]
MTNSREVSPSRQKELKEIERAHQSGSSGDFFRPDQSGSSGQKGSEEAERGRQREQTRKLSIRATSPVEGTEKRLLVSRDNQQELVYGEEARFMLTANERIGAGPTRPEEQRMNEEKFKKVKEALLVNGEKSYTDQGTGWKFDLEEEAVQAKQPENRGFDPIRNL